MRLDAVLWPDGPWPALREEWRLAERLGVAAGWVYDHLDLGGRPVWHEAHTLLAAAAASTTTIGLGTMVTSPNFRHPATSVKASLTLAELSDGRFTLGIGAGGRGVDSDAFGGAPLTPAERGARFREWVELADALRRGARVSREGRFVTARDLEIADGRRRLPLAIAATGRRGIDLAVEFGDLWITQDVAKDPRVAAPTGYGEIARQLALVDEACAAAGREPSTLSRLAVLGYGDERPLASLEAFRDAVGRYTELGIDRIAVLWPRGDDAGNRLAVLEAGAAELAATV